MYILTADKMRAADEYTINNLGIESTLLMGNAAKGLFDEIAAAAGALIDKKCCIVVSNGNNGGDGLALAGLLYAAKANVCVILASDRPLSCDAQHYFDKLDKDISVLRYSEDEGSSLEKIKLADIIVDALFGTGFKGSLKGAAYVLAGAINEAHATVFSADIPSGCICDTGAVEDIAVFADYTVTFSNKKPCHFLYPAAQHCGKVIVKDIGIPPKAVERTKPYIMEADPELLANLLPSRAQNSNKGSFGRLCLLCGSDLMPGAVRLAARAALKSGVGLLQIASTESVVRAVSNVLDEPIYTMLADRGGIVDKSCEQVLLSAVLKAQAVVAGCGLGVNEDTEYLIKVLLQNAAAPVVLDADGISALKENINILSARSYPTVITPHPLELARLLGCDVKAVQADRVGIARSTAEQYKITVVLKGANTVIASQDGLVYINPSANSGLAKGGSGDVLSGIIGAFLAQGLKSEHAAVLGVYLHSQAGRFAAARLTEFSMLPSELCDYFPNVFCELNKMKNGV